MRLTDEERAMLDGAEGPAKQRAMDLLVRYGEALDAERLVEVTNVAGTWSSTTPWVQADLERPDDFDTIFSRFNLDADDTVETPRTVVSTCQLIHGIDTRNYKLQGFSDEQATLQRKSEEFFGKSLSIFGWEVFIPGVRITLWIAALIIIGAGLLTWASVRDLLAAERHGDGNDGTVEATSERADRR